MALQTPRQQMLTRHGQLKTERASWYVTYKDLSQFILPYAGRFFIQDRNRGWKRNSNILDNTGTRGVRILAAGMMGGMTSPARPWFKLGVPDRGMAESRNVKIWLNQCTKMMRTIFEKSNTYRALHQMYEELGTFGTAVALIKPDFNDVIRLYPITCGEYALATSDRGEVDTIYREFQMTVSQLVKEFGREQCSVGVQAMFDRGQLDQWITVLHCIEPREDRDPGAKDNKNMPWKSIFLELNGKTDQYLAESGMQSFGCIAPRWSTSGGDIYGNGPGMEALGDVKQLQQEQLRKGQAIDFQTRPPLQVPISLKNREIDSLPGGVTYIDSGVNGDIKTQFEVRLDLGALLQDVQDVRQRINSSFFADLFLMLANSTNTNMTATEVAERHEEKLLMLGPVLERLQAEMLNPLIETTFNRMIEADIVPQPPEELHGITLNVEYVSMLAQAQQAAGINTINRFVQSIGQVAQFKPEILDKFNADQYANIYADRLGVDPELLLDDEQVAAIRQQRQQQIEQAQKMEAMSQAASSAQKLGSTPTGQGGGSTALNDIMGMFQGYNQSPPQ